MRKETFLPLLTMLALSCGSCVSGPPATPPRPAVTAQADAPAQRRAEILTRLQRICPRPRTPAELRAAADRLAANPALLPAEREATRLDNEARTCRGMPV